MSMSNWREVLIRRLRENPEEFNAYFWAAVYEYHSDEDTIVFMTQLKLLMEVLDSLDNDH